MMDNQKQYIYMWQNYLIMETHLENDFYIYNEVRIFCEDYLIRYFPELSYLPTMSDTTA